MDYKKEVIKILIKLPLPFKFTFDQWIEYMTKFCGGKLMTKGQLQEFKSSVYDSLIVKHKELVDSAMVTYGRNCFEDEHGLDESKNCLYLNPKTNEIFGINYYDPGITACEPIFQGHLDVENDDIVVVDDGNKSRYESVSVIFQYCGEWLYKDLYNALIYFNYHKYK